MALEDQNIDEQMAADWTAIREKHAVEEEPAPIETPAPEQTPEPTPESVVDRGDGRRNDGTFAPKAKEPSKNADNVDKNPPPAEPLAQDPVAPERDISKAPSSWKPMERAEWEKLSPAAREAIHRRETDFLNGQRQLLPDAQLGKSMREVVAPYKALIDAEAGGRPEVAFAELMKTAAILRMGTAEQKRNVVLGVARQYGVDLGQQPQQQQPNQPQQTYQDPRVDQLLQHLQTQEQQRQQAEQQGLLDTVTRWVDQKDEQGVAKYPYLNDVQGEMAVLVPMIRQSNPSLSHEQVLQSAYERAIWANPDVKPLLLQAQAAVAARPSENQDRVREAKRAASVNVPRRASTPSPGKPGTMDETIAATARTLGLIT
jgi:hypothetical protein